MGDRYKDQLVATGHESRLGDIELLADLGLAAVRFPVLWERVSPERPDAADWAWSDVRLARLGELGIRPILGLVHHGSGPCYTSLLEDSFAPGLAAHALAVARRYPWVEEWTPVNEPLTTARFSALYGHWYPHATDERSFWVALLNQIDAVRLSMKAIRTVNPNARLIQTEDLGRTYSTPPVSFQADFDNARRWMTWDLLVGRVTPAHELWRRLADFGLEARLHAMADEPCPPDVIGINHYLTSDRLLDHRIEAYPPHTHGGNSRMRFADIEGLRALNPPPQGLRGAIREAWARYGQPIALTEVHNGCTREEQLRWLREGWMAACEALEQEVDVRAVTPWALFGSQGWNTLLTGDGVYETGAYDVSSGTPRPTAIAAMIKSLPQGRPSTPALHGQPWWSRDIRLVYPAVARAAPIREHVPAPAAEQDPPRPILITGATGTLGRALAGACTNRGLAHVLTGRGELDLTDRESIAAALDRWQPWAVVNAAGWVRVDQAEGEREACLRANTDGAIALSSAAASRGLATLNFSSDLVFDGGEKTRYVESDSVAPLNSYGVSKARMEEGVLALGAGHLIVRTAAFFSPYDEANFAVHAVRALSRGERFAAAEDLRVTPTYVPDLCAAALDLLIDGEHGLWHLSSGEGMSWAEFGRRVAIASGLDPELVDCVPAARLGWHARRPPSCELASERGLVMPSFASALSRFAAHLGDVSAPAGPVRVPSFALAA